MPKTMLIDAYHPEETRVALLQGGKVEDFDFEYASRKPLRGNIYLARITRVEPSLQAAFIEYGGNRHGFLAFGEIHPDYYQIPVADREVLRKAEALEVELAQKLQELNNDDDDDDAIDPDDEDELRSRSSSEKSGKKRKSRKSGRADDSASEAETASSDDLGDDAPSETEANGEDEAPDFVGASDAEEGGTWHSADESLITAMGEAEASSDDDAEPSSDEEEEEEEEEKSATDEPAQALEADDDALRSDEEADVVATDETVDATSEADAPLTKTFEPLSGARLLTRTSGVLNTVWMMLS